MIEVIPTSIHNDIHMDTGPYPEVRMFAGGGGEGHALHPSNVWTPNRAAGSRSRALMGVQGAPRMKAPKF